MSVEKEPTACWCVSVQRSEVVRKSISELADTCAGRLLTHYISWWCQSLSVSLPELLIFWDFFFFFFGFDLTDQSNRRFRYLTKSASHQLLLVASCDPHLALLLWATRLAGSDDSWCSVLHWDLAVDAIEANRGDVLWAGSLLQKFTFSSFTGRPSEETESRRCSIKLDMNTS